MIRAYEALYIVNPDLADEQIDAVSERYKKVVEQHGGEIENINRWEKRRLAYEVKGFREGIYVQMNFKSDFNAESELNRLLKNGEEVLRHIIVNMEEK